MVLQNLIGKLSFPVLFNQGIIFAVPIWWIILISWCGLLLVWLLVICIYLDWVIIKLNNAYQSSRIIWAHIFNQRYHKYLAWSWNIHFLIKSRIIICPRDNDYPLLIPLYIVSTYSDSNSLLPSKLLSPLSTYNLHSLCPINSQYHMHLRAIKHLCEC